MIAMICLIFFFSGVSALIFETAWFYLAGIALGNTVWSVSIVLAAFMLGLSIGNALAFAKGRAVVSSVRLFAFLQLIIASAGIGSVLVFPHLPVLLLPFYRSLQHSAYLLNLTRLLGAFLILAVPCVCMGATLPVLVNALYARNRNYAGMFGLLYGSNALGAVVGVLLAEFILIRQIGVRLTGLTAACFNLIAGATAFLLSSRLKERAQLFIGVTGRITRLSVRVRRILVAAFLSGAVLLALEVVWFRFLALFFNSLLMNFAIMLACVLAGIALGSLSAAWWFLKSRDAHVFVALPVALAGMLISALYTSFYRILAFLFATFGQGTLSLSLACMFLMLPVCFLSGMVFTMLARQLADNFENKLQATGIFALANTLGSMCGALLAGLILLPALGMERSFFALAALYGLLLVVVLRRQQVRVSPSSRFGHYVVIGAYLLFLLVFGWGMMSNFYSRIPLIPFIEDGARRIVFKEGSQQTAQLIEQQLLDTPYYRVLVANNQVMSSTTSLGRRYMKYFAWFPLSVHPQARDVLVLSYGLGNTASAVLDDPEVERVDVVDISKEVLEASRLVYGKEENDPLTDQRVSVHLEDGRFFLLASEKKYDLITGEPPLPKNAGVLSFYTEEYFRLLRGRR